jgi:hypothetical protein
VSCMLISYWGRNRRFSDVEARVYTTLFRCDCCGLKFSVHCDGLWSDARRYGSGLFCASVLYVSLDCLAWYQGAYALPYLLCIHSCLGLLRAAAEAGFAKTIPTHVMLSVQLHVAVSSRKRTRQHTYSQKYETPSSPTLRETCLRS